MRRRQPPAPDHSDMPAHLAEFHPEDWQDEVGPPPFWWDEPGPYDGSLASWQYFKARLLHMRAVRAWRQDRGVSGHA